MTLKEEVLRLVNDLPEDSELLKTILETVEFERGLDAALEDSKAGRVFEADEFLAMVKKEWPRKIPSSLRLTGLG